MKKSVLMLCACCLTLAIASSLAFAERGDLLCTYSLRAGKFALDSVNDRLYASLPSQNSVAVIDTNTLQLVATVPIGLRPRGLALSPDNSRLFVANGGSREIGVLDTSTLEVLSGLPVPYAPSDIEVGMDGRLYVTPDWTTDYRYHGIMQVDSNTGQFLGEFALGVFVYYNGLLEISPDRDILYFGNVGLSPATLAKYDVSTVTPSLLYRCPHGALGSNGQDLTQSHSGDYIYYCVGSGNGYPYYQIAKIRTSDMVEVGRLASGPYPRQLALSPDDAVAYVVHTQGHIDLFDTASCLPIGQIGVGPYYEGRELIVDPTGSRLFAAFDGDLRVYDTGFAPPPIQVDIDIRPGDYPNVINLRSNAAVPVAILTTDAFDATTVDPTTVQLAGASVRISGKGNVLSSQGDIDDDGDIDLLVHVETQGISLQPGATTATLMGRMFGGDVIEGSDDIVIVPRK